MEGETASVRQPLNATHGQIRLQRIRLESLLTVSGDAEVLIEQCVFAAGLLVESGAVVARGMQVLGGTVRVKGKAKPQLVDGRLEGAESHALWLSADAVGTVRGTSIKAPGDAGCLVAGRSNLALNDVEVSASRGIALRSTTCRASPARRRGSWARRRRASRRPDRRGWQ